MIVGFDEGEEGVFVRRRGVRVDVALDGARGGLASFDELFD